MPVAKSSLHSGRQFRSVQRISSAMAESSMQQLDVDEDDPEDVDVAGEAVDRAPPPPPPMPPSPPLQDLAFFRRTCDLGKMPVSELHTFLPRYQSANEFISNKHFGMGASSISNRKPLSQHVCCVGH